MHTGAYRTPASPPSPLLLDAIHVCAVERHRLRAWELDVSPPRQQHVAHAIQNELVVVLWEPLADLKDLVMARRAWRRWWRCVGSGGTSVLFFVVADALPAGHRRRDDLGLAPLVVVLEQVLQIAFGEGRGVIA
eukprot:364638-Chlamydomonas_euryale.AAC.5